MHISIKWKVTMWYTAFMALMMIVAITTLVVISNRMTQSMVEKKLELSVSKAKRMVIADGRGVKIAPNLDEIEDAQVLVYAGDGKVLYGSASSFLTKIPFKSDQIQLVSKNGNKYYIYDDNVRVQMRKDIWIRGIISVNHMQFTGNSMFRLVLIVLPILIIIATIGGYLITKKAFGPVVKITETANNMSDGNDLSQRIQLGKAGRSKDEISELADTFNHMLDRLAISFDHERQFTADASHEMRTPVAVILAQAEYLLTISKSPDEKKAAEIIVKQSGKMTKLIQELLMISRMDHQKQKLNLEDINISELTEMVIEEFEFVSHEKKIEFIADIQPDVHMLADQTMMMRVFINLISNALKYGKKGGSITVRLISLEQKILISVADDGIGIGEEDLKNIWKRFYQVDSARTSEDGSSGLGLAMVEWIVDAHHGRIDAESTLGEGSIFRVVFPVESSASLPKVVGNKGRFKACLHFSSKK